MSAAVAHVRPPTVPGGRRAVLTLARADARWYAGHPLFLLSCGVLLLSAVDSVRHAEVNPNPMTGTLLIAFFLGVFGFVVAHRLTSSLRRTGDLAATAPVDAQQRTAALLLACSVPAAVAVVLVAYMIVTGAIWPPEGTFPGAHVAWFRDEPDVAVIATLIASGPVAALGGPMLGVAVARWAPFRGSALIGVVALVFISALSSDAPGAWRLLSPWPVLSDERVDDHGALAWSRLVPGVRPEWVAVFLLCLCGLAAVAALLRDRGHRRVLLLTGALLALLATISFGAGAS